MIPDPTKLASDAYDFSKPNIAINVGDPPTAFHVNAGILRTSSGYFKAVLSRKAIGKQPLIQLPEHGPFAFNTYLNWLHRGKLFVKQRHDIGSDETRREWFWETLLDAYILGSKLEDCDFKDAIADAALLSMLGDHEGVSWLPGPRIRQRLYQCSSTFCPLRRVVVHIAASLTNVKELLCKDDPPAFIEELKQELAKGNEEDTYEIGAACGFHEHAPGKENCYRSKTA